jgi:lipoate-protein ligase A
VSDWLVEHQRDTADRLHATSAALVSDGAAPWRRRVRILEATAPAVVLGRAEELAHVDLDRAAAAGMAVVRRSSGGGAVLVGPGEAVWIDVVIPAGDPLWSADVGRAMWWVGDAWVAALADLGIGPGAVWRGGLVASEWSRSVCFAGLGAGEVTVPPTTGDRPAKILGVSQRRTRHGALLQCAAPIRWDPARILDVLALSDARRRQGAVDLAAVAVGVGSAAPEVVEAVVGHLTAAGKAQRRAQLP